MPRLAVIPRVVAAPVKVTKGGQLQKYDPNAQTARSAGAKGSKAKKDPAAVVGSGSKSEESASESGERERQPQKLSTLLVRGDVVAQLLGGGESAEAIVRSNALFQGNPRKTVGGSASRREGGTGYGAGKASRRATSRKADAPSAKAQPLALPSSGSKPQPLALPSSGSKPQPLALPAGKSGIASPGAAGNASPGAAGNASPGAAGIASSGAMGFASPGELGEKAGKSAVKTIAKRAVAEAFKGKEAFQQSTVGGMISKQAEDILLGKVATIRAAIKAGRKDKVAKEVAELYAPGVTMWPKGFNAAKFVIDAVKKGR